MDLSAGKCPFVLLNPDPGVKFFSSNDGSVVGSILNEC